MNPFDVSNELKALRHPYPLPEAMIRAGSALDPSARRALASLWYSEGIPFAFKDCPGLYEALREWLSDALGVHWKEITLIGSGRLGYRLSATPAQCVKFGPHSDLDLTVVSARLFGDLIRAFERWSSDYLEGRIEPSRAERAFWDANLSVVPQGINRGFVDPQKIPARKEYPESKRVLQALYVAKEKLGISEGAPSVRKVTIRVYGSWGAFMRQLQRNIASSTRS